VFFTTRWLLSAALLLAPTLALTQEIPPPDATPQNKNTSQLFAQPSTPKNSGDLKIENVLGGVAGNEGILLANGPVNWPGGRIETPEGGLRFFPREGIIKTFGETRIDVSTIRALALNITLSDVARPPLPAAKISSGFFRFGFPPGYMQGESFRTSLTSIPANAPATPPAAASSTRPAAPPAPASPNPPTPPSAAVSVTEITLKDVTIYYQEPDFFSISVDAGQVTLRSETPTTNLQPPAATSSTPSSPNTPITPEDRRQQLAEDIVEDSIVHVEDAVVRIASVPVLYIPGYTQQGLSLPPIRPIIRAGQKDNIGTFLRTTIYYTGWRGFQPGLLLDGYAKAGVLVGPALDYDTTRRHPFAKASDLLSVAPAKGSFQGAWIADGSNRGTDTYGRPIDAQRGFIVWNHKQTIFPNASQDSPTAASTSVPIELTASVNYWSDTSVLRDFRPDEFNQNQRPDNFIELVLPFNGSYLSAFARFHPDDFLNVQQRLPEIRFDMPPREIAHTGVYQHLNASFSFLYERTSPEYAFPGVDLESSRFDAYYGLVRPFKISDWFSFTPVAGVRATTYLQPVGASGTNQGDPFTRVLPQLGFDLQLLASGRWEHQNDFWEINGLRHRARPIVQYRWIPAADKDANRIPSIDRYAFVPFPPPIDLEQKRYADDLWEQQVFRIGLENVFQTRDSEYGSRDLAWLNFYQDFRDTSRPGERTRSTFYTQLGLSPARWLDINLFNRVDTYTWYSKEVSVRLDIHDGDRWRLWFGAQYTTDIAETNQYYWGIEYHLNSNYSLRGQWRFDSEANRLTEQYYGLRQRLGNNWTLEYHLSYRRDARRDNGFSFGANLRLTSF
jgi:LPS-assembly protein